MLNNLEKHFVDASKKERTPMPMGTKREIGEELIRRAKELDLKLEKTALQAERDGDTDACWLAMAARAQCRRNIERITNDLENEPK